MLEKVTIIIPCRNEVRHIGLCLESVFAGDYPGEQLEVLVVDGMSSDGTRQVVEEYAKERPNLTLLDNPKRTIPAAMNIGIRHSTSEIILKVDAHDVYQQDYVRKCVEHMRLYDADNAGGMQKAVPRDATFSGRAIALALGRSFGTGNGLFRRGTKQPVWSDTAFSGCYRRSVFDKIGLYDENIARSEDIAINSNIRKAGGRVLLVPHIVTAYYARSTLREFSLHNFDNGFWITYPMRFGRLLFSLRHVIPLLFVTFLGLGTLSCLIWKITWVPFIALLSVYLVLGLTSSTAIAYKEKSLPYLFLMPLIFLSMHVQYGLGSLWGLLRALFCNQFWTKQNIGSLLADARFMLFADKQYGPAAACRHREGSTERVHTETAPTGGALAAKRLFDLLISSIALAVLSPVLLLLAVLIKKADGGPVFYMGVRIGKEGRPFIMYKLRTMVAGADRMGAASSPEDDPRVTGIGRFLRKYKLDELPQLVNVLKGEMSLVGPRPQVPWAVKLYSEEEKRLLTVRPGMTDWASIRFRDEGEILRGSPDPDRDYFEKIAPEKMRLGLEYIARASIVTDLKILFTTVVNMARAHNER